MAEFALNWQVLLALIVIVGFIVTIVKPILALNTTLTKLINTIEGLQEHLLANDCELKQNNIEHREIYGRLGNHDIRIEILEKEGGK